MQKKDIVSVGILVALVLAGSGITYALLQFLYPIHNNATITAIGIKVLDTSGMPITNIDWGLVSRGSENHFDIQILNNGTVSVTLSIATQDWNPPEASMYVTQSWNYTGAVLDPSETIPVTLILTVDSGIIGITDFSWTVIITATGT